MDSRKRVTLFDANYNKKAILDTLISDITISYKVNEVAQLNFSIINYTDIRTKDIICENIIVADNQTFVIKNVNITNDTSGIKMEVSCSHISSDLTYILVDEFDEIGKTPTELVTKAIEQATSFGFTLGNIKDINNKKRSLQAKEQGVFQLLVQIAELFDARLTFDNKVINLTNEDIYRNTLFHIKKNMKNTNFTKDASSIITTLIPLGASDETTSQEINIMSADANIDKKSYMENYTYYTDIMKIPLQTAKQTRKKVTKITFENATTSNLLWEQAEKYLNKYSQPLVTLEADVIDFSELPEFFIDKPILGETVRIKDSDISIDFTAKVVGIEKNLLKKTDLKLTITNFIEYSNFATSLVNSVAKVDKVVTNSNQVKASYIDGQINLLNTRLNSTVSKLSTDKNGALLCENSDYTKATKMSGGILACGTRTIAERDSNLNYVYKNAITGEGIIADIVTLGCLQSGSTYWNMDNAKTYNVVDENTGTTKFTLQPSNLLMGQDLNNYKLWYDNSNLKLKNTNLEFYNDMNIKTSILNSDGSGQLGIDGSSIKWNTEGKVNIDTSVVTMAIGDLGRENLIPDSCGKINGYNWYNTLIDKNCQGKIGTVENNNSTNMYSGKSFVSNSFYKIALDCNGNGLTEFKQFRSFDNYKIPMTTRKYSFQVTGWMDNCSFGKVGLNFYNEFDGLIKNVELELETTFKKKSVTFDDGELFLESLKNTKKVELYYHFKGLDSTTGVKNIIYFGDVKLELGDVSTIWCPTLNERKGTTYTFDEDYFTLNNKQNKTFLSADGIVQTFSQSFCDNSTLDSPFTMRFYIDPNVISVQSVIINIQKENFRSYVRAVVCSDGGGSTRTSSGGGGFSATSGVASQTEGKYGDWQETTSNSTTDTGGYHKHLYMLADHSHNISVGSHSHSLSFPDHSHSLSMSYGIFEGGTTGGYHVYIDGNMVLSDQGHNHPNMTFNLSQWVTTPGFHTVQIGCGDLSRVSACLSVKTFHNGL